MGAIIRQDTVSKSHKLWKIPVCCGRDIRLASIRVGLAFHVTSALRPSVIDFTIPGITQWMLSKQVNRRVFTFCFRERHVRGFKCHITPVTSCRAYCIVSLNPNGGIATRIEDIAAKVTRWATLLHDAMCCGVGGNNARITIVVDTSAQITVGELRAHVQTRIYRFLKA